MGDQLTFTATAPIEIQAAPSEGKRPTFRITAYTGAPMNLGGFYHPVIVDLSGLKARGDSTPILLDHDPGRIIGQADSVVIDGSGVHITGTITGDDADAQKVITHARNGFNWRASIGASIVRREFLEGGKSATVNGRKVSGPMLIARESQLAETSFVAVAADGATSAAVAAKGSRMSTELQTAEPINDHLAGDPDPAQAERQRCQAINAMAAHVKEIGWDNRELVEAAGKVERDAIAGGWPIDQFRATLSAIQKANPGNANFPIHAGSNGGYIHGGNSRDTLTASCMLMGGHGEAIVKAFPNGERLANSLERPTGWPELATMALRLEGQTVPRDRHEIIKAAFSTTSLPTAVGSSIAKAALPPFLESASGFRDVSRVVAATDFRPGKALRLITGGRFEKVGPGGELKHADLSEESHDFKVDTYGEIFGLDRQTLINDDASVLSDIPTIIGNDAARKVASVFFDVLADDAAFFNTDNANVLGAGSALSVESLGSAVRTLRTQRDPAGRVIGLTPAVLMVPASLEFVARAILNSVELSRSTATDGLPTGNPLAGLNLTLHVDPRLDEESETAWYLFAPARHGAILLAALNGVLAPVVESREAPPQYLGIMWRGYLDFGIRLAEHRAAVRASGAPAG